MTLKGHTNYVYCCDIIADRRVTNGSAYSKIKIWNLERGKCEITLKDHGDDVICCIDLFDGRIVI